MPIAPGDKAVASDLHMGRAVGRVAVERDRDGKDRYFEIKGGQFILLNAREPGVFERGSNSGIFDCFAKRHYRVGKTDTAPELAFLGQGHKDPAFLRQRPASA